MKLHVNKDLFSTVIDETAEHFAIRVEYVEKDYWVTYFLKNLHNDSSISDEVVFKGGTSLSKAYKCIDRFSEDVDLVLLDKAGLSGNQIKNVTRQQ